ncbi:MAG: zinc-ribbon domain-containing protein [Eubacteriales bacterium]
MKFCTKCGYQNVDDARFCQSCGAPMSVSQAQTDTSSAQPSTQAQPQTPPQNQGYQQQNLPQADNSHLFCILSYIGVLWLFGLLLAPERFNPRVKFNVGQGIIASIVSAGLSLVAWILTLIINLIFRIEKTLFGYGTGIYEISPVATVISNIIWVAVGAVSIALMVYGIVKVAKHEDAYLPIVGKYAFYK